MNEYREKRRSNPVMQTIVAKFPVRRWQHSPPISGV